MTPKFIVSTLSTAVALSLSANAFAKDVTKEEKNFEQITVIGSASAINDIPGSATFIGEQELEKFEYTDISRVLSAYRVYMYKKKTAMAFALTSVCVVRVRVVTTKSL